ncbi:DUF4439 domain-containing protein [Sanguibacter sp. 25GB23B1]|uniref:DUF4439 domain-containing protein n=1 Tax=unclassified Sanguibacter TaxID=2645534 RepID=UPI0032AF83D7
MIGTLLAVAVLSGCGIRLESPAIPELAPDADEISRQAMVADSIAIRDEATEALLSVPAESPAAASLQQVADFAVLHVDALGGEYVSGLSHTSGSGESEADASTQTSLDPETLTDEPLDGAVPPEESTPVVPATSSSVVSLLAQSSARARGSLATPVDGPLARLYVSIAASQIESARALAAAAGIELVLPEAFGTALPTSLPANLSTADLTTLVRSEDSAGYAYEVAAARLPAESRTLSLARAAAHRERGQEWAELASVAETSTDPRQVAYDLPDGTDGGAPLSGVEVIVPFAAGLESTLTTTYTTLAGQVAPEERAVFLDLVVDTYATARVFSAPLLAFPGMPERL